MATKYKLNDKIFFPHYQVVLVVIPRLISINYVYIICLMYKSI